MASVKAATASSYSSSIFRWMAGGKVKLYRPVPNRPLLVRADLDAAR